MESKVALKLVDIITNMEQRLTDLEGKFDVSPTGFELMRIKEALEEESKRVKPNEYVGRIITDAFCNGVFGRDEYGMEGARIESHTETHLEIRKTNFDVVQEQLDSEEDMRWFMDTHTRVPNEEDLDYWKNK